MIYSYKMLCVILENIPETSASRHQDKKEHTSHQNKQYSCDILPSVGHLMAFKSARPEGPGLSLSCPS